MSDDGRLKGSLAAGEAPVTVRVLERDAEVQAYLRRGNEQMGVLGYTCLLYTSPSPRDRS